LFHPIDYLVFKGMKESGSVKGVLLLDREAKDGNHRPIQRSIEKGVQRENYEWQTLRVQGDGKIKVE
jgi:predicted Holliday junction resolvase-like endonuclease